MLVLARALPCRKPAGDATVRGPDSRRGAGICLRELGAARARGEKSIAVASRIVLDIKRILFIRLSSRSCSRSSVALTAPIVRVGGGETRGLWVAVRTEAHIRHPAAPDTGAELEVKVFLREAPG
jgi:hypothetical protein